mmetsp:Transcript_45132/g.130635  ORF Transcript_45132/g.130635 Transcript_45132/m.130635 type:complete len:366 (+) Transcript_45132:80-1177(+)
MLARLGPGCAPLVLVVAALGASSAEAFAATEDSLKFRALGMRVQTFSGQAGDVRSMAFSPCGTLALTGHWDGTGKLWSVATRKHLLTLTGHSGVVLSVAFSPGGERLLTGSSDNTARLWDATTGKELLELRGHGAWVVSAALSPDAGRVLTGARDGTARLWDAATGEHLRTIEAHGGAPLSVAFSADGEQFLTSAMGDDNTTRLWDTASQREMQALKGHTAWVVASAWGGPGSARVLTGSHDGTARLWSAGTGKRLLTLDTRAGDVLAVALSADAGLALTGSRDATIRLWNMANGEPLRALGGHRRTRGAARALPGAARLDGALPAAVMFHPDDRQILVGLLLRPAARKPKESEEMRQCKQRCGE